MKLIPRVVRKSDFNENPVVSLDLDFVHFVTIAKVPCTAPNLSHGIKLITTTPLTEYIPLLNIFTKTVKEDYPSNKPRIAKD